MNVLHITLSYSRGGRREAISELCRGLAKLGVVNRLCCIEKLDCPADVAAASFEEAIELGRRRLFDWNALARLRDFCRSRAIEIVHAHDAASEAASVLAMPAGGPQLLMTFHRTRNFESARMRDRMRNAIAGLRAGAIVTASEDRRRHYLDTNHISPAKVLCIPLGVDLERFRPDPARRGARRRELGVGDQHKLIGVVGHFGPEKGVDLAIDAFQRTVRSHPALDCSLAILGGGSPAHEQLVRSHVAPEFADRVRFLGFQSAPEEWFPAFDVLLHGARREAFGLAIVEAMACGVPVVAARVGGIPEIVVDGRTGRLADHAEAPALSEALDELVLGDLSALSAQARAHAEGALGGDRCARQYHALYEALLRRRSDLATAIG
ncbi:MAG TPA: glycosyltransferase family 4 protein [Rhodanobacteraceae bacterium]|jgi:glycosyltransferase involved in cell wall biosynthesis|nr:glycosyltransferase family 4 protein [Rhodanobacteraceae bacterium]